MKKIIAVLLTLSFAACESITPFPPSVAEQTLKEKQLETGRLFLALPDGYTVKETDPRLDFTVYHIVPKNDGDTESPRGGIYLGNYPSMFYEDEKKAETFTSNILGEKVCWNIYEGKHGYLAELCMGNKSNQGWNQVIHLFGSAKTKEELLKVIYWYSTLKRLPESK